MLIFHKLHNPSCFCLPSKRPPDMESEYLSAYERHRHGMDFKGFTFLCFFPVFDVQLLEGRRKQGRFLLMPNWDFMLKLMKWKFSGTRRKSMQAARETGN